MLDNPSTMRWICPHGCTRVTGTQQSPPTCRVCLSPMVQEDP